MGPGDPRPESGRAGEGAPVGRRLVFGLVVLGAAGVVGGNRVSNQLARWIAPAEMHDPTGLLGLFPLGDTFRYYSVTGSVPEVTEAGYRLTVGGEVRAPASYSYAQLRSMPQTAFVRDFQCVTGWRVPQVQWSGVRLAELIARAGPGTSVRAVRFRSFDGTYTESLTLAEAMRPDVIVALEMQGAPVTHDHGGPVRMYCGSMYGYKSTKWLSAIELTDTEVPGYWETRGYDIDGTIRA